MSQNLKHDHNDKYAKREVCYEKHVSMNLQFDEIKKNIDLNYDKIESALSLISHVDKRLTKFQISSLSFAVATLVTLIIALVTGKI